MAEQSSMSSSTPFTWGCCDQVVVNEKYATCVKCHKKYHYNCLSLKEKYNVPNDWQCPTCINSGPKISKSDSTPLRNVSTTRGNKRPALGSPPKTDNITLSCDDIRQLIQDAVKKEQAEMLSKFTETLNRQLQPIKEQMDKMDKSMLFMNSQYEDLLKEYCASKETVKELQKENLEMKMCINDLSSRVNQLEQQTRSIFQNIEIQCLPEKKQENLLQIVTQLSKVVGSGIVDSDIKYCTRVAKQSSTNSRPRSIVVQLASPRTRDQFLAATIKYNKSNPDNKLNTSHLGYAGPKSPIFITEHLSTTNKALHTAARIKAKELGYQFVWVRGGRIFIRKEQESEHILVRSKDTLNKLA
ncbi:hypothetical protein HW555_014025 [Spodoptera exigua]|uniref:FP protein C-terminal domain-containing protein n=1 Tax=Spodoptera exigua TaxID=7107 RepID=A0A835G499_SPOEX|nr:hypothetical protein HW555_014025 [Spodoptera exigua]